MIGKIERVPLRDIWKYKAYDFTSWLQDNIDVLNDALGLSLSNPEREQSAGSFNVDLVAEDENGNPVIIACQLIKSNYNHLGKLITYLTAIGDIFVSKVYSEITSPVCNISLYSSIFTRGVNLVNTTT